MLCHARLTCCSLLLLLFVGCDSTANMPGGTGGTTSTASGGTNEPVTGDPYCGLVKDPIDGKLTLLAKTASNYSFTSAIDAPPTQVASSSNLTIDWSGVTKDIIGQPVIPDADIDLVTVVLWNLTPTKFQEKLNSDQLAQSDTLAVVVFLNSDGRTSANLDEFDSAAGYPVDFQTEILPYLDANTYPPNEYLYSVMVASGTTLGAGTRMIATFQLDASSSNKDVAIASDSIALTYDAKLTDLEPVEVPLDEPEITIDWLDMNGASNALGGVFAAYQITEVIVARYSLTPMELQSDFLSLEHIADDGQLYRGEVLAGASFSLAEAANASGSAFSGFDDQGTWVIGLRCGGCSNPAPWYLTLAVPCSSAP